MQGSSLLSGRQAYARPLLARAWRHLPPNRPMQGSLLLIRASGLCLGSSCPGLAHGAVLARQHSQASQLMQTGLPVCFTAEARFPGGLCLPTGSAFEPLYPNNWFDDGSGSDLRNAQ